MLIKFSRQISFVENINSIAPSSSIHQKSSAKTSARNKADLALEDVTQPQNNFMISIIKYQ